MALFCRLLMAVVSLACVIGVATQQTKDNGLYISNGTHIYHATYPEDGYDAANIVYSSQDDRIVGLAVDLRDQYIFWSDVSQQKRGIYRARLAGGSTVQDVEHIVSSDITEANGLTVDYVSKHLYWTDARKRTIEVSNYDGTDRRVLVDSGLFVPRGIIAYPQRGYLFWNDQGNRRIERSNLDGSERTVILDDTYGLVQWPNQMVVYENNLYWVDAWNKTLMTSDLDGGDSYDRVALMAATSMDYPIYGLAIYRDVAYVSVWGRGMVLSVDLVNREVDTPMTDMGYDNMFSLYYADEVLQETSGHACSPVNGQGGCSHLCLPTGPESNDYRCSCPSYGGMVLIDNDKECRRPDNVLLYALADLGVVGFTDPELDNQQDRYLVGRSLRPVAVAYDPVDQVVYWSDVHEHVIHKANLDGSEHVIFLGTNQSVGVVDGLAVDPKHRNLYYSNMGMVMVESVSYSWHKIEMVSLSGGDVRTVVDSAEKPRALWVDSNSRYLFHTDWGSEAKVVRTNLDGSNPVTLAAGLDNPNGVAVDDDDVYVVDSHYKTRKASNKNYPVSTTNGTVLRVGADGEGRQLLADISLHTPFGLAVGGDRLFVSDWQEKAILSYSLSDYKRSTLVSGVSSPMGLFYSRRRDSPGSSGCESSSCDAVCISQPSGSGSGSGDPVCACSSYDADVLQENGRSCAESEQMLFIADMNSIKLVSLDGTDRATYIAQQGCTYFANYVALVYDDENKAMYFSDVNKRKIYHSDGTTSSVFYEAGQVIDGLALDSAGARLFWTDYLTGTIASVALSGEESTYQEWVTGRVHPRAITVTESYLYWTEWGDQARVSRISLQSAGSPSAIEALVTDGLKLPNGLWVDEVESSMYVGDADSQQIWKCDIDGNNCQVLSYLSGQAKHLYSLLKVNDLLLLSDWETGSVIQVHSVTGLSRPLVTGLMRPSQMALHMVKTLDCPADHGCSDTCTAFLNGFECSCPVGQVLEEDSKTCVQTATERWQEVDVSVCTGCTGAATCGRQLGSPEVSCTCTAGFYMEGTSCQKCAVNTYKSWVGRDTCRDCPEGATSQEGSSVCSCGDALQWDWQTHTCQGAKPGVCPSRSQPVISSCFKGCDDDSDCTGAQKCCNMDNCNSYQCVDPDSTTLRQCVYSGRVYQPGSRFRPNPCTLCSCQPHRSGNALYGGATCTIRDCPVPPCTEMVQYVPSGGCCPVCNITESRGTGIAFRTCPTPGGAKSPTVVERYVSEGRNYVRYDPDLGVVDLLNLGRKVKLTYSPPGRVYNWKGTREAGVWTVDVRAEARRPDGTQDIVHCRYNVAVRDDISPEIICPDDIDVYTREDSVTVNWLPPRVSDNIGIAAGYPKSAQSPGESVAVGAQMVSYTAKDVAGNTNQCSFKVQVHDQIEVCSSPPEVYHGDWECYTPSSTKFVCVLTCGRDSTLGPETFSHFVYTCEDGKWLPTFLQKISTFGCVRVKPQRLTGRLQVSSLECQQPLALQSLAARDSIARHALRHGLEDRIVLTVDGKGCGPDTDRRKREAGRLELEIQAATEVGKDEDPSLLKRQIDGWLQQLRSVIESGELELWTESDQTAAQFELEPSSVTCLDGEELFQDQCMVCPVGSYEHQGQCVVCPSTQYQDLEGQTRCKTCPGQGVIAQQQCTSVKEPEVKGKNSDDDSSSNLPLIIGGLVGVVVLTLIVVVAIVIIRKRKVKTQQQLTDQAGRTDPTSAAEGQHQGQAFDNKAFGEGPYSEIPEPEPERDPYLDLDDDTRGTQRPYAGLNGSATNGRPRVRNPYDTIPPLPS